MVAALEGLLNQLFLNFLLNFFSTLGLSGFPPTVGDFLLVAAWECLLSQILVVGTTVYDMYSPLLVGKQTNWGLWEI